MKAVIESREELYLIRIYGSDERPCDAYVVDQLEFRADKGGITMPANSQDVELAMDFKLRRNDNEGF